MTRSARLLRPIETPSTTAKSITMTVAIRVMARVTIVSFQSPVQKMTASQTTVITAGLQPPRTKAMAISTSAISHHGESASRSSTG